MSNEMFLPRVKTIPLLLPFAWLYQVGVQIRNWAFDKGYLKQESFDVPIISVGNIAVGGSGKTPHVEYLIRLLQQEGIGPIAVLSRGYKRQSKGFQIAQPDTTAAIIGDESYQLHRKFPEVIIAVDADRPHGVHKLLELQTPPAVILLDDAYQHRYIKPGLSILLTSYNRILYKDLLMPAGRLREPRKNINRADIVIVTKCPPALREEEETEINGSLPTRMNQPIYYSGLKYSQLINLATGKPEMIDHTSQVLLLTGIADPDVLEQYIQTNFRLRDKLCFGDHHNFNKSDISEVCKHLRSIGEDNNCTNNSLNRPIVITTEKDAARLFNHPAVTPELKARINYLPTEVFFLNNQDKSFNKKIIDYVRKNQRDRSVHSE